MEMTEPRRDTSADAPQVDHVRDAMRHRDDRQEPDDKGTQHKLERDDTLESDVLSKPENRKESGKP
jgi:hypothetical protein